jgi:hypothetical protein
MAIFPSIFYGYAAQYPITVIFCVGFTKLYDIFKPFESRSDNVLADVGQYQVLFVYYVGSIIYFKSFDSNAILYSALDYSLIAINLTILVLTFYFAYDDYTKLSKTSPQTSRVIHKRIQLQNFDLCKNHFHLIEINEMLCSQPDEGIELMLALIYERLYSRGSENTTNRCFYYYPMTPLPLTFYAQGYNTVEYYCPKYSVYFYRVDTCDIDRFKFISTYSFEGKLSRIVIPEEAFGRHIYRSRHVAAVTRREELLAQAGADERARLMLIDFERQVIEDDKIRLLGDSSQTDFGYLTDNGFNEPVVEVSHDVVSFVDAAHDYGQSIDENIVECTVSKSNEVVAIKSHEEETPEVHLELVGGVLIHCNDDDSRHSSSLSSLFCEIDEEEGQHSSFKTRNQSGMTRKLSMESHSTLVATTSVALSNRPNSNSLHVLRMTSSGLQNAINSSSYLNAVTMTEQITTFVPLTLNSRTQKSSNISKYQRDSNTSTSVDLKTVVETASDANNFDRINSKTLLEEFSTYQLTSFDYDDDDISIDATIDEGTLRREGANQLLKLKTVQDEMYEEYKSRKRAVK